MKLLTMNESIRELLRAQQERNGSLNQTQQQQQHSAFSSGVAGLFARPRSPQHSPAPLDTSFDRLEVSRRDSDSLRNALALSNEIKRLQQLQQLTSSSNQVSSASADSLLLSHQQMRATAPSTMDSALLQHYLLQKVQAPRLDLTSLQSLGNNNINSNNSGAMFESQLLREARMFMRRQSLDQQFGTSISLPSLNANSASAGDSSSSLPSSQPMFQRDSSRRMRGGVIEPFPEKLHRLLLEVEAAGRSDVISFVSDGRAFAIHRSDVFFNEIVPLYFRQSRLSSFKRQLNLYGFELITTGPNRGAYYHELFQKDKPELCIQMRRVAIKVNAKSADAVKDAKSEDEAESGDEKPSKEEVLSKEEV